ncbi:MAG: hypothetical protein K8S99_11745 [Planctomycetes bacterium]|nr:hypothetical protein [Planctomycetota bacterium]
MPGKTYIETFDKDLGGWIGWIAGGGGGLRLDRVNGAVVSRSPWGIDVNHGPPGAGYMHLIFGLPTLRPDKYPYERLADVTDANRYVLENYPTDFTNAKFTVRVRGDVDLKGTQFLLHAQADVGPIRTNWALTGQPIGVTKEWTEQTLHLTPDESQWTCMGVRKEGADCDAYGRAPIADALRDLNINVILVIGMLDVVPVGPCPGDPHVLKAGKDYFADRARLPEGEIWLDTVKIEFAQ